MAMLGEVLSKSESTVSVNEASALNEGSGSVESEGSSGHKPLPPFSSANFFVCVLCFA